MLPERSMSRSVPAAWRRSSIRRPGSTLVTWSHDDEVQSRHVIMLGVSASLRLAARTGRRNLSSLGPYPRMAEWRAAQGCRARTVLGIFPAFDFDGVWIASGLPQQPLKWCPGNSKKALTFKVKPVRSMHSGSLSRILGHQKHIWSRSARNRALRADKRWTLSRSPDRALARARSSVNSSLASALCGEKAGIVHMARAGAHNLVNTTLLVSATLP
jgi:hypothetical protein